MKTHPCIRRTMLGVLLALLIVPAAWAQKIEVQFDEVAARNAATVRAKLAGNAHFQYTGGETIEAVVVVLVVMDSTITSRHQSAPFTLRPGVPFTPGEDQLPDPDAFPEGGAAVYDGWPGDDDDFTFDFEMSFTLDDLVRLDEEETIKRISDLAIKKYHEDIGYVPPSSLLMVLVPTRPGEGGGGIFEYGVVALPIAGRGERR